MGAAGKVMISGMELSYICRVDKDLSHFCYKKDKIVDGKLYA